MSESTPCKFLTVEDIRKIRIEEGDGLIVTMPRGSSQQEMEAARNSLKRWLHDVKVKVLILPYGYDVQQIKWNSYVESLQEKTEA